MTHTTRLAELLSRGWTCEHPNAIHRPIGRDGVGRGSVYLEGLINSHPREAFLSIEDGLVMLIRGEDYTFDEFIALLDRKPEALKVLPGQKSLLGDELNDIG